MKFSGVRGLFFEKYQFDKLNFQEKPELFAIPNYLQTSKIQISKICKKLVKILLSLINFDVRSYEFWVSAISNFEKSFNFLSKFLIFDPKNLQNFKEKFGGWLSKSRGFGGFYGGQKPPKFVGGFRPPGITLMTIHWRKINKQSISAHNE